MAGTMAMETQIPIVLTQQDVLPRGQRHQQTESLQTAEPDEAEQILMAKNQADRHSAVSFQIAKAYLFPCCVA